MISILKSSNKSGSTKNHNTINEIVYLDNYLKNENSWNYDGFSPFLFEGNQRKSEFSKSFEYLVFDVDNGLTKETFEAFFNTIQYKAYFKPSSSHTDDIPRYHIILPLKEKVVFTGSSNEENKSAFKKMYSKTGDLLGVPFDPKANDIARLYFGSALEGKNGLLNTGKILSTVHDELISVSLDYTYEIKNTDKDSKSNNKPIKTLFIASTITEKQAIDELSKTYTNYLNGTHWNVAFEMYLECYLDTLHKNIENKIDFLNANKDKIGGELNQKTIDMVNSTTPRFKGTERVFKTYKEIVKTNAKIEKNNIKEEEKTNFYINDVYVEGVENSSIFSAFNKTHNLMENAGIVEKLLSRFGKDEELMIIEGKKEELLSRIGKYLSTDNTKNLVFRNSEVFNFNAEELNDKNNIDVSLMGGFSSKPINLRTAGLPSIPKDIEKDIISLSDEVADYFELPEILTKIISSLFQYNFKSLSLKVIRNHLRPLPVSLVTPFEEIGYREANSKFNFDRLCTAPRIKPPHINIGRIFTDDEKELIKEIKLNVFDKILGNNSQTELFMQMMRNWVDTDLFYQPAGKFVLIKSHQGAGKNSFARLMSEILGQYEYTPKSYLDLMGSFGYEGLEGNKVAVVSELDVKNNFYTFKQVIKELATESLIEINSKNAKKYKSYNFNVLFMFTNEMDIEKINWDESGRREAIFESCFEPSTGVNTERVVSKNIDRNGCKAVELYSSKAKWSKDKELKNSDRNNPEVVQLLRDYIYSSYKTHSNLDILRTTEQDKQNTNWYNDKIIEIMEEFSYKIQQEIKKSNDTVSTWDTFNLDEASFDKAYVNNTNMFFVAKIGFKTYNTKGKLNTDSLFTYCVKTLDNMGITIIKDPKPMKGKRPNLKLDIKKNKQYILSLEDSNDEVKNENI